MKEKNYTIIKLSEQTGVAVGTIQKMQVDPACNPTLSSLRAIASVLKTTIGYLIGQTDNRSLLQLKTIPVFELKNITLDAPYKMTKFINALGAPIDTVPVTIPISNKAFALRMWDDSMSPLFVKDNLLVFDPKQSFKDGSYILVKLAQQPIPVLKQLVIENDKHLLYAHGDTKRKKTGITLTPADFILATLVQAQLG